MTEAAIGALPSQASRIGAVASARPDAEGFRIVRLDGSEDAVANAWLDRRSSQLAGALADRGVGHGDRLGLGLRNSPELVLAAFAAWKLGAVPVPVRWDLPDWELSRLRDVIAAPVFFTSEDIPWIERTEDLAVPDLPDAVSPHLQGICSSGSTGTPKIILSAMPGVFNPMYSTPMAENWMAIERPQRILVLAPMYHVNAFTTLHNLLAGDELVVLEKFDATRAVELIEKRRITTFTATPTMLQRMADVPGIDDRDLSSLVWIQQGAAPMPPSLVHRWAGLIGPEKIVMAYGMTEALGITALRGDEWMKHEGSVGLGLRGTEIRIVGDDGVDLPAGEIGEIYLRAPNYGGSTYVGDVPQLKETADGFRTAGDMGYLDEDGYLYIADRRVDLIISGGANVFPAEVEHALIDHPQVADVVVVGLRDEEWGRRVHAIIEPTDAADPPSFEDMAAYAKARLAAYKVPKSIEIVDSMPRSEATKVNRARLIEARGG
ncbi:MAG TPA: AMP-binding protein [Mycobacteriales bacterium]|nr:AMP-binding protein [Mycobacteriales bacterium]